jgi:hypothetical protein
MLWETVKGAFFFFLLYSSFYFILFIPCLFYFILFYIPTRFFFQLLHVQHLCMDTPSLIRVSKERRRVWSVRRDGRLYLFLGMLRCVPGPDTCRFEVGDGEVRVGRGRTK